MLSLRARLTLWYLLVLAVALVASGGFWYLSLERSLQSAMDARLERVAKKTREALQSYSPRSDCGALMHHLAEELGFGEYIEIRSGDYELLCASANLGSANLSLQVLPSALPLFFQSIEIQGQPLRMMTLERATDEGLRLRVAGDMTSAHTALASLVSILTVSIPLVVLGVGFCGWFLARKALEPVDRINRAVQKINASSLNQRLPEVRPKDEIGRLVETFNSMLERLEDSFQKIRQFSGDASHELRTPLTIIRGEIEVAMRWGKDIEEFKRVLASNMEEVDLMTRIIEDLLALSKSEEGRVPLQIKQFNLSDMIQHLYWQTKVLGEENNIHIDLHLNVSEEVMLAGDELRLRRLFLNLISNAIKYNHPGGSVSISLALENGCALVQIQDTGIGIAEEDIPRIFERFFRVDKARNREVGGTGLGLAIVKSIVDAHGGDIRVHSSLGEGSRFIVSLPLQSPRDTK